VSEPPTPSPRVHPYSPPLLPTHLRSLPLLSARVVKLLCPVVPLAFRTQSLPTHHFSNLAIPSSLSPADSTVVHRHSLPLFLNVDLGRSHRSPINHYSTSPLHYPHLLARHGYRVHMRLPLVCIASVQCFGRRQWRR
jgi:hypothetical protein